VRPSTKTLPAHRTKKPAPSRQRIAAAETSRPAVWILAVLLVVAGAWSYATSFRGVFVGDDIDAIVNNPHITSLWPLEGALTAPRDTTVSGRPVLSLSFAINYALASPNGLDPWGYHAVNLAIHLAAGLVLFGVARRSLQTGALSATLKESSTPAAFAIALLWLLHPLQTSAVTYVVQRAEALMGLFLLLTVYCTIRATDPPTSRTSWWTVGAIAACALGMGSKETMAVAPILAAVWFWLFRPERRFERRTWTLLGGLAATWTLLAWLVASNARGESVGLGLGGWTGWAYLRTQAGVIVHYLRVALMPSPLVFSYAWPPAPSWISVMPQVVLLAVLAVLTVVAVARRHSPGFLGAWFFLILAPTSSVLPIVTEVAAEHRMYLPLAAVIAAVVPIAFLRLPQLAVWVVVVAIAATFGTVTRARNRDYWSLEALMQDTVEKRPDNAKARVVLGGHLVSLGRFAEAENVLRGAIAIPRYPGDDPGVPALAHMYLGSALAAQHRLDEGIAMLETARALHPGVTELHALLGEAYASQGRLVEAAESYDRAVAALPDVPLVLDRAARLRATAHDDRARDGAKALRYAERAVQITGGADWRMLDTLASAFAESGRFAEAAATIHRAIAAAQASSEPQAAALLRGRLALYEAGLPLREP
jgi:tetratricopeptide (TPR) repeat protein